MSSAEQPGLKCMLLAPIQSGGGRLRQLIISVVKQAGFQLITFEDSFSPGPLSETVFADILKSDLVIAVLNRFSPGTFYEVGLSHAAGKPVIFISDEESATLSLAPLPDQIIVYKDSEEGMARLRSRLRRALRDFERAPRRFQSFPAAIGQRNFLPAIDVERLAPREFENLCFELLTQIGYRSVKWGKQLEEIDIVATLPKKDPDGFEYNELWFISMGLRTPPETLIDMIAFEPDYFVHRLQRGEFEDRPSRSSFNSNTTITFLIISIRDESARNLEDRQRAFERRQADGRFRYNLRLRIWDRQHLTSLIQQYPQIAYKYFSEEGKVKSQSRMSYEQLYIENAALTKNNEATIAALKEERDKRARAERDAVWKEVAFKAAHKLGNPIFALETNLQSIRRKIGNEKETIEIASDMGSSIEKAKTIIEQFKSLTKAQQISPRSMDILPLIRSSAQVAINNGVQVNVIGDTNPPPIFADPLRMTECFDELFANALHWLSKKQKTIDITIDVPQAHDLPSSLDNSLGYVRIRFADNGCGIAPDKKEQVFDPFYTTYPHGAGLGLSLVQRVIEGHGGVIREVGKLEEGAAFEMLLPQAKATK
jgi:signal transduction histidine kinase